MLEKFGDLRTLADIAGAGYILNNHGYAMIAGEGVSFVNVNELSLAQEPLGDDPPLLLFIAADDPDTPVNETEDPAITDLEPDEPYEFVGWAYAIPLPEDGVVADLVGTERPRLGCVPYHEWFIHAAGWHTPDNGGMVAVDDEDGDDDQECEGPQIDFTIPTLVPNEAAEDGATPAHYHPELWDIHFWVDRNGDPPRLGIENVGPDGELIPSEGFTVADGDPPLFYYPPMPVGD